MDPRTPVMRKRRKRKMAAMETFILLGWGAAAGLLTWLGLLKVLG